MQFNKTDCINKDLIKKLKEHMKASYKLGTCQTVSKDTKDTATSISQSSKDTVESLSTEENEESAGIGKRDFKFKEHALIGNNFLSKTPSKKIRHLKGTMLQLDKTL